MLETIKQRPTRREVLPYNGIRANTQPLCPEFWIQSSLQRFIESHHGVDHVHNERSNRAAERRVLELARRWELEDGGQATDQTLLARLQHHGSPTRLLDVTSD